MTEATTHDLMIAVPVAIPATIAALAAFVQSIRNGKKAEAQAVTTEKIHVATNGTLSSVREDLALTKKTLAEVREDLIVARADVKSSLSLIDDLRTLLNERLPRPNDPTAP